MSAHDPWRSEQRMSSLDVAQDYARTLVRREVAATGGIDNALRRVGERAGVGYWTLWALFHRRRKAVDADTLGRLRGAMIRQLETEVRHLEHELQILRSAGTDPRDTEIAAVAADLAKARQALGIGASP
jgi:hypothetical protein